MRSAAERYDHGRGGKTPRSQRVPLGQRGVRAVAARLRSIRLRLTVLNVLLVALVLVGLSAVQYALLRRVLLSQTASLTVTSSRPAFDRFTNPPPKGPADPAGAAGRLAGDLTSPSTSAVVLDQYGSVRGSAPQDSSQVVPLPSPNLAVVRRVATSAAAVSYTTTTAGSHLLVTLTPLRYLRGAGGTYVAQVATPLTSVDGTLHNLALIDLAGVAAALVVALALSTGVAALALAPLRRMIGAAERLGEGDLSQRVLLAGGADEAGQLAEAMNRMAEQLEALFAAQRQFVSDASHELRTPLTIVRGNIELLLSQAEADPERVPQLLRSAHRELARMSRLVAGLLELARIDAGLPLNPAPTALAAARAAFDEAVELDDGEHALRCDTADAPIVHADPDRVAQILRSLLDNARKYTPAGRGITVRTGASASDGWVEVEDEGLGIAPEQQALVFERFYRVDNTRSRDRGGSGLGLAIARSLAEAQHGRLELARGCNGGARFRLVLPLEAAVAAGRRQRC